MRFRLAWQPVFSAGAVVGCEAFLRPADGASAFDVVEAARASGECRRLDAAVLRAAARGVCACGFAGELFWNVTWESFSEKSFAGTAARLVAESGVSAGTVVAEVGERMLVSPGEFALAAARWRERGFLVALDDFGRGGSNLALVLGESPPDVVKVDGRLLRAALGRRESAAALRALVVRLKRLTRVVVEGVEAEREAAFCRRLGPGVWLQGYALCRPGPLEAVVRKAVVVPDGGRLGVEGGGAVADRGCSR